MTTVTKGAYLAALEKKLMEAERSLYGFRCIFNNLQENLKGNRNGCETASSVHEDDGRFIGQLPYPDEGEGECEE